MKEYTTAIFPSRTLAETAIEKLNNDLEIGMDDISYVYRNSDGEIKEVDAVNLENNSTGENASEGAVIGGGIGAALGIATAVGMIPVIGPIFAAGPLIAALGIGGAAGVTAAGAVTGAVAGGLIGALSSIGTSSTQAKKYEDLVLEGNVLVAVHAEKSKNIASVLKDYGAMEIETVSPPSV